MRPRGACRCKLRTGCKSQSGLSRQAFNKSLYQRFALKCGHADASGCIPWLGRTTNKGYGVLRTAGGDSLRTTAHRFAWVIARGDLEPNQCVLHRCDNPACVNVEHLFVGSPKENTEDMVEKGRHSWRKALPWQKLAASDVHRISEMRSAGLTQQQVANSLGVSRPLISMIEHGRIRYALQS